jgi:hypothetical protein
LRPDCHREEGKGFLRGRQQRRVAPDYSNLTAVVLPPLTTTPTRLPASGT